MQISRTSPYRSPPTPSVIRMPESPRPATRAPEKPAADAAAPAGSGLWDLLTPDEQAFFVRQDSLGSLTYGPHSNARPGRDAATAPLGGRIDVKA